VAEEDPPSRSIWDRPFDILLDPIVRFLDAVGSWVLLTGRTLWWAVVPPYRPLQFLRAMEFVGAESVFIVSLTGVFSGMVLALQMVYTLRQFGAESVVGSVVAISLMRELSPIFAGLMVTARAGSSMAAELGNMRITEQIDALTTMGVSPVQYLLSPRMVAGTLMMPLLCILYTSIGMIGAWGVAVSYLGVDPGVFIANIEKFVTLQDFMMGEIKATVFGFLIAAISCNQGFFASGGAKGVGSATTSAVVQSAVSILIANFIITSILT
jgi:phospholipid/cholesterol/gamma-HCH transport system permease protein